MGLGYRVFVAHVLEVAEYNTPRLEGFHMLQEFKNVLPDEIPRLRVTLILPLRLCLEQHQCPRHLVG